MSGLYLHIPFCKRRCIYCGFFSTTQLTRRDAYVDAMCREMQLRQGASIETVYLGGGTPSQLSANQLRQLFDTIMRCYDIDPRNAEITMECNPDDIDEAMAATLRLLPVNRVSMGVQTFNDERLRFLHRRHDARQSRHAVKLLRDAGIDNISIDLMFGFPCQRPQEWETDIEAALSLDVEHISAYSLMYEEGTPLYGMLEREEVEEVNEDIYIIMYNTLVARLQAAGYEHYEISNFARPGRRSRHNSNYWDCRRTYIGIGAGAHSYDLASRKANVADLDQYIDAIGRGELPCEIEVLNDTDHYNDIIATALRTAEGIRLDDVRQQFGGVVQTYLLDHAANYLAKGWLKLDNGHLHLTHDGIAMSDTVMSDLVIV